MKCPHCDYKDGWDREIEDEYVVIEGDDGPFWEIKMERDYGMLTDTKIMFVCPACEKTFIE